MDERSRFVAVIGDCARAAEPSRSLDAKIATAVFPGLAELEPLEEGVWAGDKGTRVRALRYTGTASCATTLVPAGCWLELREGEIRVCGASGEWAGAHNIEAIGICIAALRARADSEGVAS